MPTAWLLLHSGALGDLVLSIQLMLRLPGGADSSELHVVSRTDPGDLSMCRPRIRRQSSEGVGLHWLFGDRDNPPPARLCNLIRGAHVLSALGGPQTTAHERLSTLAPARLVSIDPRPRAGVSRHIVDQWQTQLEAQGLLIPKCVHQQPRQRGLGVPDELRQPGRRLLRQMTGDASTVLIHPGSGGRKKCWPLRYFVEVARRLRDEQHAAVAFVVGHVEIETWSSAELQALTAEFPVLTHPEMDELAAVVAGARVFIGNDAGPSHLAALLGTPTVTIFGPTSSLVWCPLGASVKILQGDAGPATEDWGICPDEVLATAPRPVCSAP